MASTFFFRQYSELLLIIVGFAAMRILANIDSHQPFINNLIYTDILSNVKNSKITCNLIFITHLRDYFIHHRNKMTPLTQQFEIFCLANSIYDQGLIFLVQFGLGSKFQSNQKMKLFWEMKSTALRISSNQVDSI